MVGRLAAGRVVISRVQLSLGDTAAERRSEIPRAWRSAARVEGSVQCVWCV